MNKFGPMVREEESCCEVLKQERTWEVVGSLWLQCEERTRDSSAVGVGAVAEIPVKGGVPGLRSGSQGSRSLWVQGSWQDRQPCWLCRARPFLRALPLTAGSRKGCQ